MSSLEIVLGAILICLCISIVAIVLFQEGREQTMGGVITGGGADTFLSKNKHRIVDAFLARLTKIIAICLFLLAIILNAVTYFDLGRFFVVNQNNGILLF
ncbi:MAG: preprotein translocase subunit SecG [Firmicutes bacterium]|nr:preprotein translocase subunit SecG [Bacillota bacterium]